MELFHAMFFLINTVAAIRNPLFQCNLSRCFFVQSNHLLTDVGLIQIQTHTQIWHITITSSRTNGTISRHVFA